MSNPAVYEFTLSPPEGGWGSQNKLIPAIMQMVATEDATADWISTSISWDVDAATGVASVTVYGTFNG